MIKSQFILAIALLTQGWGASPIGEIVGKSYSLPYCIASIGDPPAPLPEPVCFDGEYLLFVGAVGFDVDRATWDGYELGDWYEE